MNPELERRLAELRGMAEVVCIRMRSEVEKLQLEGDAIEPDVEQAAYSLSRDPASGGMTLVGVWRDQRGRKLGEMLFHADGSFYAEYDVIRNHPRDGRWFVEAVTAWGWGSNIKSELRLLPAVQEG